VRRGLQELTAKRAFGFAVSDEGADSQRGMRERSLKLSFASVGAVRRGLQELTAKRAFGFAVSDEGADSQRGVRERSLRLSPSSVWWPQS
jgi:hypothetical protein